MGDSSRLEQWLVLLASRNGSDLLLVAGAPPSIRVDSKVIPLAEGPLDGLDIEEAVIPALAPHARHQYRDAHIADASFRIAGVGRFRVNLHRERGRAAAAVRLLPTRVPRLSTLGLPPAVELLATAAARAGSHRRADRIGKDDDARRARRGDQSPGRAAYRHDRRSDRVRASTWRQPHRAGRDRRRCAGLSNGAPRRRAPGAGRHRRGRDARPGDDADRDGRRRDRAPGVLDHSHDRRRLIGVADCRFVSAGTPEHHPAGTGHGARRSADTDAAAAAWRRASLPPPSS